jgi:hypothetical protein
MLSCRTTSRVTKLILDGNRVSARMHKSLEIELVLCQLRRPDLTQLMLRNKGLQDSDVARIGAGLVAYVA